MKTILKITFLILALVNFASSGVLPVEKCSLEDSSCLLSAFQTALPYYVAGLPSIGIDVLDVLDMDDVNFDISGLQFSLVKGQLKGLKNVVFDAVSFGTKTKEMQMKFHFDGECSGDYTAGGQIFGLPINGQGKFKLTFKNMKLDITTPYEMVSKHGKTYVEPKQGSYKFEIIDGATYELTNLFNGNKDLSNSMHDVLNKEWKAVSIDFGDPIVQIVIKKLLKNLWTFFKTQPLEDIAILN